ncbi:hypothetical protein IMSAG013_01133 [Clostridiales bacterium]|nr:hypothetical protein IMSAG013_01133 [Clostridiales bacterium]
MAREKESYRDSLARLDAAFPDKEMIPLYEAAKWLGMDPRTVKKRYGGKLQRLSKRDIRIGKSDLARCVCS